MISTRNPGVNCVFAREMSKWTVKPRLALFFNGVSVCVCERERVCVRVRVCVCVCVH